ncbi:hypothetical protein, partial [Rubrolithibacter danxiaensis]|uniref:hypothetical protein n=1 Tax=Rubrolithibacter danxiaensis TaxID=3390805 RepID=UPI003BF7F20C
MKKKCLIVAVVIFQLGLLLSVKAQTNNSPNPSLENILPPSPNAAALTKFGDIPVGLSTGIPQINVPLYSYASKTSGLKLNVSLDYHAGGIKVDEVSSNVGIGWALNAGGVVSRTMRGIYDEMDGIGFINSPTVPEVLEGNSPTAPEGRPYNKMYASEMDSQNDIFSFNFNGRSGKFVYGKNNDSLLLDLQKLKIQKFETRIAGYSMISSFIITDENGYKYYFDAMEITHNNSMGTAAAVYTSSWYLTKIETASGSDFISLEYENSDYTYNLGKSASEKIYYPGTNSSETPLPQVSYSASISNVRIEGKRLKLITFPDGVTISFDYSTTERTVENNGDFLLKKISVQDISNKRGYKLIHDVSINRPTLKEVVPFGGLTEKEDSGYQFSYDIPLPDRLSEQQDHWGFYNNNIVDGGLIPEEIITVGIGGNYGAYQKVGVGNRDVDPVRSKAGTLKTVRYPTGGSTTFEFESNKAVDDRLNQEINVVEQKSSRNASMGISCNSQTATVTSFSFEGDPNSPTEFNIITPAYSTSASNLVSFKLEVRNSSGLLIDVYQLTPASGSTPTTHQFSKSNLSPGTYEITTYVTGLTDFSGYIDFRWLETRLQNPVHVTSTIGHNQVYAGGLRVKKIIDYSDSGSPAKIKEYEYLLDDNITSSGTLGVYPVYTSAVYFDERTLALVDGYVESYNQNSSPNFFVRSSSTIYPLTSISGSPVTYKKVVEKITGGGVYLGRTERYFTSFSDVPVVIDKPFPFAPPSNKDWFYGALLKEVIFDNDSHKVKETVNEYTPTIDISWQVASRLENFKSVSIAPVKYVRDDQFGVPYWTQPIYFKSASFYPDAGRQDLTKTIVYDYYANNSEVKTEIHYQYDPEYFYLKSVSTSTSDGRSTVKTFKYPPDITSGTLAYLYTDMSGKNIINPVVEQIEKKGEIPVSLLRNNYSNPFPNTYVLNTVDFQNGNSALETRLNYNYNSKGRIVSMSKSSDAPLAYIWGYKDQYPVAEVKNATEAEIAYASFEGSESLTFTYNNSAISFLSSKTGKNSYTLSSGNTISKAGLSSAKTYIVSYWTTNSTPYTITGTVGNAVKGIKVGGWTYYEHKITGQTSIILSGSGNVDELRLYPSTAQMTTYTYEPLVGMTSRTDEKGQTTYYEYDDFQRLAYIKDQYGN